jgi:cyclopropane fatty-acyl-phospholipid synthase-like methyltransferase
MKVADLVVRLLGLSEGAPHILDIGGGAAGLYASAILSANPNAKVTQIDWPHINVRARERLVHAGLSERFATIDGDFHSVNFGRAVYDVAIASHLLHQESPESNQSLIERTAVALRPEGRMVVSGWIVNDGRAGPAASLMFNTTALVLSHTGKAYERHEIQELLLAGGFSSPKFTSAADGVTVAVAQKRSA